MKKISVVLSVFNEEKNLADCLESVHGLADEIIVVDNSSTDQTAAIAQKYTQKIYQRPNFPMLNKNKNFGFSQATGDWILNLDGDERVTEELKKEILAIVATPRRNPALPAGYHPRSGLPLGYEIPRKNIIFGQWIQHGLWWPDYQLRLFQRGRGQFPCRHVHEKIKVQGETGKLASPLLHHNYQTVSQFIQKMDRIYTEDEVECRRQRGQKVAWHDAIRMPVRDFLSVFFAREGFKDGLHGLVLALLQSFYALVVFAKTWEKQGFPSSQEKEFLKAVAQEFKQMGAELRHWLINSWTKEGKWWRRFSKSFFGRF